MNKRLDIIFKPETNRTLYILLLIATPFLLLQNYMQSTIGELSNLSFAFFGTNVPVTVTAALVIVIAILCFAYKKLNGLRIVGWLVVAILLWVGQKSTDFYFNHKFYELQYNWHYFAYAIFAYLNYMVLSGKNASPQKIISFTFVYTLAISTFDEAVQMPLSNRVFDLGDIAKDLWGSMMGLFIIFFILENGKIIKNGWEIRHKKLKEYINGPVSMLVLGFLFAYVFMVVTSLLTETSYIVTSVFISMLLFALIFGIVHLSRLKLYRNLFIAIFATLMIVQGFFIYKYHDEGIVHNKNKLLVYNGVPIYFFDVLIYPDGMFRLVDKKEVFNKRDQQTILGISENIIVIGSGTDGQGGKGFPQIAETQFVFNKSTERGVQIIILKNDEAIKKFNKLKSEAKRPTLIFHNN